MTCALHLNYKKTAIINSLIPSSPGINELFSDLLSPEEFVDLLLLLNSSDSAQSENKKKLCSIFLRIPELYAPKIIAAWETLLFCDLATDFMTLLPLNRETMELCLQKIDELKKELAEPTNNFIPPEQNGKKWAVIDLYSKVAQINPQLLEKKLLAGEFNQNEALENFIQATIVETVLNRYAENRRPCSSAFRNFLFAYYRELCKTDYFQSHSDFGEKIVRALMEGQKINHLTYIAINQTRENCLSDIVYEALEHQNTAWAAREMIELFKNNFWRVTCKTGEEETNIIDFLVKNFQKKFSPFYFAPNFFTKKDIISLLTASNWSSDKQTAAQLLFFVQKNLQQKLTKAEQSKFLELFLGNLPFQVVTEEHVVALKHLKLSSPASWLDVYQTEEKHLHRDIVPLLELALITDDAKLLTYCQTELETNSNSRSWLDSRIKSLDLETYLVNFSDQAAAKKIHNLLCESYEKIVHETPEKIKLRKLSLETNPQKLSSEIKAYFKNPCEDYSSAIDYLQTNKFLFEKNLTFFTSFLRNLLKNQEFYLQKNEVYNEFFDLFVKLQKKKSPCDIAYFRNK